RDRTDHDGCDSVRSGGRPDLRHWRLVRRFAVRQSQRSGVPLDLLRADRGGGDLRSAGAGWRAALRREIRRVGKGALAPGPSTRTGRGWWARFALPTLVIAQSDIVRMFREEWPAATATAAGRCRSDRAHPEQFAAALEQDRASTFIGPGWLPEQSGS